MPTTEKSPAAPAAVHPVNLAHPDLAQLVAGRYAMESAPRPVTLVDDDLPDLIARAEARGLVPVDLLVETLREELYSAASVEGTVPWCDTDRHVTEDPGDVHAQAVGSSGVESSRRRTGMAWWSRRGSMCRFANVS